MNTLRVNLGNVLNMGLGGYVKAILLRDDPSRVVFALDTPSKPPQYPVLGINRMMQAAMCSFHNRPGDVKTQDWVSTLQVESHKGLGTPLELLETAWLALHLEVPLEGKAGHLGYLVEKHDGGMEDNCFCCFKDSAPHVWKYSVKEKHNE